jgi:hypothetical protein
VAFFQTHDCCFAPVVRLDELKAMPPARDRGFISTKWGIDYLATHDLGGEDFLDYPREFARLGENDLGL